MSDTLVFFGHDLTQLEHELWSHWQQLTNLRDQGAREVPNYEDELDTEVDTITELMLKYESLLHASVVVLDATTRGTDIALNGTLDSLQVKQTKPQTGCEHVDLTETLAEITRYMAWIRGFRAQMTSELTKAPAEIQYPELDDTDAGEAAPGRSGEETEAREASLEVAPSSESTRTKLLSQTKKITHGLMRGSQALQSGLLQSDLNLDELRMQTQSLQKVDNNYTQLEQVFTRTNRLVKTLERASQREKRDVYLSLAFLAACITWVLWRRIFRLPVRLGLWLLFQFFRRLLVAMRLVAPAAGALWQAQTQTQITGPGLAAPPAIITADNTNWQELVQEAVDRISDEL